MHAYNFTSDLVTGRMMKAGATQSRDTTRRVAYVQLIFMGRPLLCDIDSRRHTFAQNTLRSP